MQVENPVVAANDALLRPSGAARVYERITGHNLTGDGLRYHEAKGRIPSIRTVDGQVLFRLRDVVEFAERRMAQDSPVELAG